MKVITHEDWMKNTTPRVLWVWDDNEADRKKRKVIYISERATLYPVITLSDNGTGTYVYKHCAEIAKTRRMTNKELSRWLRENTTRECHYLTNDYIYSTIDYRGCQQDEEVSVDLRIREDDGEWREPLVEVEE